MSEICPICLEDLNRPSVCERSVGGMVTEIVFGLKDDVQIWPKKIAPALRSKLSDHIETAPGEELKMKSGKRMFKMAIKKNSGELKYAEQGESGSKSFKPTLEIYSSNLRAQLLGFMAATANQELVILAKTRNGDWHLLGDEYEGCEHESAEATSGKAGSDNHGAQITFFTETDAPTIYKGDVDSLLVINGQRADISAVSETVSGTDVTLSATVTDNDDNVTKVGFRYKEEGTSNYIDVPVSSHTSGSAFSETVEDLDSGDYIYYAYMVANGVEYHSDEYSFTIA